MRKTLPAVALLALALSACQAQTPSAPAAADATQPDAASGRAVEADRSSASDKRVMASDSSWRASRTVIAWGVSAAGRVPR